MREAIIAKIKEGGIVPVRDRYGVAREFLKKNEGKEVLILKDTGVMKTEKQLGYLFGVVFRAISDDTGYTEKEVYQVMQRRFARYIKSGKGKAVEFTKGLSEMTKIEAGKFIDNVVHYARTEMALTIPDPDPAYDWRK